MFLFALTLMLASQSIAYAAPPPGESAPVGGEGPLVSTAVTESTLSGFERAIASNTDISRFLAEDVVLILGYSGSRIVGRDAVAAEIGQLLNTTFAGWIMVETRIVSGGSAAVAGTVSGTHVGRFEQLAATGNSINVPFTAFYEVVDCQITSLRLDFSAADIMLQLAAPTNDEPFPHRSGEPY
jgi:hypothetical protein